MAAFVCTPIWLPQAKAFHWRGNSWKSFYLTSWIKRTQWKEFTKLTQNDLETILIGWIVAEIFDLENAPKLLTGPSHHLFDIFCEIQNAINQRGSPRSTWFMGHLESVFIALFGCMIGFLLGRNYKNVFFCGLCSVVKCLCMKWPYWNSTKIVKFSNCPQGNF